MTAHTAFSFKNNCQNRLLLSYSVERSHRCCSETTNFASTNPLLQFLIKKMEVSGQCCVRKGSEVQELRVMTSLGQIKYNFFSNGNIF